MGGPPLVGWLLALLGTATGVSCLLRARAAVELTVGERRVARAEGVKGLGMALMAVPGSVLDQRPWGAPLFTVVFGVLALWSVTLLWRGGGGHAAHHVHLAVGAAAMVYMAVAMATAPTPAPDAAGMRGMAGMAAGPAGIPALTGVLLGYFALYTLWAGIRMLPVPGPGALAATGAPASAGGPGAGGRGLLGAPEVAAACRVSLGIGMFAMLLTL